ncbi:putative LRR receptor-like serine/threonine-protein kinase [Zea mays]|uniref:Putative LRR receptor-like serine/threonine-protein kinase n=1 Tax=Zea mays TaxID=4577 RepID=A0A3L6FTE0_MAIZE|nr:putative LRR receptor-like serine/threonine-protein kinase [Zea mays]
MIVAVVVLALLLCYGAGHADCATTTIPRNSTADMLSLLDFRKEISSDPRGFLTSWNTNNSSAADYCGWNGVTCSRKHPGRVIELKLSSQSLQGRISPSLGNLTFLRILDLSSNMLAGPIPPNIGSLFNLKILYLDSNDFTGAIPSSLGNISKLEQLVLQDNQLIGTIPQDLGNLSNVYELLLLGHNSLSGSIPTTILNQRNLRILDLGENSLRMMLPSDIGNTLPQLVALSLYNNMFYGPIPASLGNASNLKILDFTANSFTGHVPSSLGNLTYLSLLQLQQNNLEANDNEGWEFIDALRKCQFLEKLLLSYNQLGGAIPNSVGKLSNNSLQYLRFGNNNLSGAVPESMGNLIALNELVLKHNNLTGPIGSWIGNLNNLVKLSLSDNNFSGLIPSSIGSFTNITNLYLQSNRFEGPIPPTLGRLQNLVQLNLSYNNLQGPISEELFSSTSSLTKCALSNNNLDGPIPSHVSNLQQLIELDLSSNKLEGEIPSTLRSLTSLTMLNLSHNMLSGNIPAELGNMASLTELDLSYNDLQGQIPNGGVFQNASAVSLVGNWRLCGGPSDLQMHPCPVASREKVAQYYIIRVLIPIFGFMSLLMLVYFVLTKKRAAQQPSLLSPLGDQFPIVSYNDIAQATKNFSESNLIGRGGCGSVYSGILMENKLEVAIKVLDIDMRGAEKSFLAECEALRNIRHRNLVPIITACSTVDINGNVFKALVYEFMPNGNLDSMLHSQGNGKVRKPLDLNQRASVAANIADVLDYLHNGSGKTIIHCDVKPSNILLDDDMNARLGDFGIAKFYLDSRTTLTADYSKPINSTGVKGTIGYIPPGTIGFAKFHLSIPGTIL